MKRPNGIKEWISLILMAVVILAGICIAYEALNQRQGVTEKAVAEVKADVKLHDTAITELKTDVKYIRLTVDEVKAILKNKND